MWCIRHLTNFWCPEWTLNLEFLLQKVLKQREQNWICFSWKNTCKSHWAFAGPVESSWYLAFLMHQVSKWAEVLLWASWHPLTDLMLLLLSEYDFFFLDIKFFSRYSKAGTDLPLLKGNGNLPRRFFTIPIYYLQSKGTCMAMDFTLTVLLLLILKYILCHPLT